MSSKHPTDSCSIPNSEGVEAIAQNLAKLAPSLASLRPSVKDVLPESSVDWSEVSRFRDDQRFREDASGLAEANLRFAIATALDEKVNVAEVFADELTKWTRAGA